MKFGMIGLGKMGYNLVQNAVDHVSKWWLLIKMKRLRMKQKNILKK